QRLHYESVVNKKKKEEIMEKMKKEKAEKELRGLTFTPVINSGINRKYSKQFANLEHRLYYDQMRVQNKKQFGRILKNLEDVEVCKQYIHKPRAKKSSSKSSNTKIIKKVDFEEPETSNIDIVEKAGNTTGNI